MPAKRIDVVKKDQGWIGETRSGEVIARGRTKEAAVKNSAKAAKASTTGDGPQAGPQNPRSTPVAAIRIAGRREFVMLPKRIDVVNEQRSGSERPAAAW